MVVRGKGSASTSQRAKGWKDPRWLEMVHCARLDQPTDTQTQTQTGSPTPSSDLDQIQSQQARALLTFDSFKIASLMSRSQRAAQSRRKGPSFQSSREMNTIRCTSIQSRSSGPGREEYKSSKLGFKDACGGSPAPIQDHLSFG